MFSTEERILAIVVEILEVDGYDAVQLREVARRGRMSLATIYKRYATRDELILAALDAWMEERRYAGIAPHSRRPGESVYAALMGLFRTIFEPWERHPAMLTAYVRARAAPGARSWCAADSMLWSRRRWRPLPTSMRRSSPIWT